MGKKKEVDDRFKKFGTVSFTATTKTNDFIDHLEGRLANGIEQHRREEKWYHSAEQ